MFHFGDPAETARIYWDRAVKIRGPKAPAKSIDEMTLTQLKNALVYCRAAHALAETELQPKEVLDVLVAQYDEVFKALASVDEVLHNAVKKNTHKYLGGYDKDNIAKYRAMVGISPSES